MDNNEMNKFVSACNEMIEGKFILADIKIAKILRAVSSSNEIYNLIAESLINYNFNSEYERIRKQNEEAHSGYMEIGEDREVIIPFVFSLLVEIDSKHLDLSEFLATNFPMSNSQKEEYESFARHIVLPFRNAIASFFGYNVRYPKEEEIVPEEHIFDVKKEEKQPEVVEEREVKKVVKEEDKKLSKEEENSLLFDRIARICGVIRENLEYIRKPLIRSNVELVANALIEACYLRNFPITIALVMSLGEVSHNDRSIREQIAEINSVCYEFYE